MTNKDIGRKIVTMLLSEDIQAYIYHVATTGSVYIRFEDPRMGSIRIGGHEGRSNYSYKFNVRIDKNKLGWEKDRRDIWRFYCRPDQLTHLIEAIKRRAETVASWPEDKYGGYKTPDFKKEKRGNAF